MPNDEIRFLVAYGPLAGRLMHRTEDVAAQMCSPQLLIWRS